MEVGGIITIFVCTGVETGLPVLACVGTCLSIPLAFLALPSILGTRIIQQEPEEKAD